MRLQNKSALVTGGARGIGAANASAFVDEGATVVIADVDVEAGEALAKTLGATFFKLDVSSESDWDSLHLPTPQWT